jgi:hypothetical protein
MKQPEKEVDEYSGDAAYENSGDGGDIRTSHSVVRGSGGPRTIAGKNKSKYNAATHGIFADALLESERRAQYQRLLKGFIEYFKPVRAIENFLVEKLAILAWRYRRLVFVEKEELEKGPKLMGFEDFKALDLNLVPRYEATLQRSFDHTLSQLERMQGQRLGLAVIPPIKVDIVS